MRYGIDLGGTKIEIVGLSETGEQVARRRIATPRGAYEPIVDALASLVLDLDAELKTEGSVGIGIPGSLSPHTGRVINANTTELIGHPLAQDVERRIGRAVRVANDANCFALSEATDGAGSEQVLGMQPDVVFGVILGTGTGGGLVVFGRMLVGPDSIAGEWAHNSLPWPRPDEVATPDCWCGRSGCIERYLCGPGLSDDHFRHSGQRLTAAEITAAAQNDGPAGATLARYIDRLGRSLASVINILNPDVIVLGGGLSNVTALYGATEKAWAPHVFSDSLSTRLVKARHGDSSGVRGAAWLWPKVPARSASSLGR